MLDGFVKVCASTPENRVADVAFNTEKIKERITLAEKSGVKALCFPELSLTAYTCGDLFYDDTLLSAALDALFSLVKYSEKNKLFFAVGLPLKVDGLIYNVAAAVYGGKLLGFVPKTYLPNYTEFYEKRVFAPAPTENRTVTVNGAEYPFGNALIFAAEELPELKIGIEICEDLWTPQPPSVNLALAGATLILNLSASDEIVGKREYRENLIKIQSAKLCAGYVYADCGGGESTTDLVYAGHNLIYENGRRLNESALFTYSDTVSEIDVKQLSNERSKAFNYAFSIKKCNEIKFHIGLEKTSLTRNYDRTPFVPTDETERAKRAELILSLQAHALSKRFTHTRAEKLVVGLSGGLDSTLALIVALKAAVLSGKTEKAVVAVTMPCFGTTKRTLDNAVNLAKAYGATLKKVDITKAVIRHFKDIKHDSAVKDVTYENAQARERTQVLMDIANQSNGLVVGTGDLSESALGWSTYNGDHMSMYAVNSSVPKTLVRYLVKYEADSSKPRLKKILYDILDTPVSPELLPPEEGKIAQKTEEIVGPYILHDFFLYAFIRLGFPPKKLFRVAVYAFDGEFTAAEIFKWLKSFYRRFFVQQFKRSCMPDGVKIGTVSLSPRGDWRMPSDACADSWLKELGEIEKEYKL